MKYSRSSVLLMFAIAPAFAGSRINPGATEGVRPVINRAATYCDQTHPKPITQADIDTGGTTYTITTSDWYALSADLTGDIVINANFVKLVFNGYTLNGQLDIDANYVTVDMEGGKLYVSDKEGILVKQGAHNIQIMNGTVGPVNDIGIFVNKAQVSRCSDIYLDNIIFTEIIENRIFNTDRIYINNCQMLSCNRGFLMANVTNALLDHCTAKNIKRLGFLIDSSSADIYLYRCTALDVQNDTGSAIGFSCTQSDRVILDTCIAENITASTAAAGVQIDLGDACILKDCCINKVSGGNIISEWGILLSNITNCLILRNIINDTGTGLQIDNVSTNQIIQNVSTNNTTDYSAGAGTIYQQSGYDGNTFLDNIADLP